MEKNSQKKGQHRDNEDMTMSIGGSQFQVASANEMTGAAPIPAQNRQEQAQYQEMGGGLFPKIAPGKSNNSNRRLLGNKAPNANARIPGERPDPNV